MQYKNSAKPDVEYCSRFWLFDDKHVTSIFNPELVQNGQQRLYSWQRQPTKIFWITYITKWNYEL